MKLFSTRLNRAQFVAISLVTAASIVILGLGFEFWMNPLNAPYLADFNSPKSQSSSTLPSPVLFSSTPPLSEQPVATVDRKTLQTVPVSPISSPSASPSPQLVLPSTSQTNSKPSTQVRTSFGHLPYQEDDPSRLVSVGRFVREDYERTELLDVEAEQAFQKMRADARAEGVALMPISGFRTIATQQVLFTRQIQRQGSADAASRLSAPPGYSEHHTGYAIDIADEHQIDTDLKRTFQETDACHWLQVNAYKYGFEQSFPENNWQGVSYEPWHWRFVLSTRAAKIFAAAKGAQE